MQKQYALNKQLTFIIPMQSVVPLFAHQFGCVTVIKTHPTRKCFNLKAKIAKKNSEPCQISKMELHSEPCKTSKMELFAQIVNGFE